MNTLNILVVSADRDMREALVTTLSRNNRFRSLVMQSEGAQQAIERMNHRLDLFDVVVVTNDAKTDPEKLAAFMLENDRVDSMVVVETDLAEPVGLFDFVKCGLNAADDLLSIVYDINIHRQFN